MSSMFNLLVDLVLVLGATIISALQVLPANAFASAELAGFFVAGCAGWIIVATSLRHYDPWAQRSRLDDAAMVAVLVAAVLSILAVVRFGIGPSARLPNVATLGAYLYLPLVAFRLLVARPLAAIEDPQDEVLIVGTSALARITAEDIERGRPRRAVIGFVTLPGETPQASLRRRVLGTSDDLASLLEALPVSEIYIAGDSTRHGEAMQKVVHTCETLGMAFALPAYSFRLDRARPADLRSISDGYLHYLNVQPRPGQRALKRLFDIASSAAALWILLPLLLTIAALIKLTSRGPIFFRQERLGLNGRHFRMLKFRSMVVNAEELKAKLAAQNEMDGPVFKMKNDPRVTWIGRFIRKFSIDELPQLINVLRGDMTIVGPRPPVPVEVAKYEPWQRRRLSVRPGLTCIWQVSGRNQITFEQWMYLDMRYIDHWSLFHDLRLIFQTVPVVLTGRGAS
jgi:exopolysaccharide biosynthesis polyprenyl glycosylphosphotransferase